jgi:hypothetical protein
MTVSAQTPVNQSNANGVTTVFPYTFRILDASDLRVDVAGVVKTLGVDYTVSGVGADGGGNVTFVVAPASGVVTRRRAMALTRETDFQDQGELPAATLDEDLDRAIMLVQQLQEQIDRAIAFRVLPSNFDLTLPPPEAGKYLQVRGDLLGLQWSQLLASGTVSASAYGLTLLNAANASAARSALGATAVGDAVVVAASAAAARAAVGCVWEPLADVSVTNQTYLTLNSGFSSAYRAFKVLIQNMWGTTGGGTAELRMEISLDGGATWKNTLGDMSYTLTTTTVLSGAATVTVLENARDIQFGHGYNGAGYSGELELPYLASAGSAGERVMYGRGASPSSMGARYEVSGYLSKGYATAPITAVRFYTRTGGTTGVLGAGRAILLGMR